MLPQNLTNEYENTDGVTHAATEVIDGHEYAVLNVYSDTTYATISNFTTSNTYAKIVLQADWQYSGSGACLLRHYRDANAILILDLHGYTWSVSKELHLRVPHAEIWDSSAAGTGKIVCQYIWACAEGSNHATDLTIRGGTIQTTSQSVHMDSMNGRDISLTIYDGVLTQGINFNIRSDLNFTLNLYGGTVGDRVSVYGVDGYVVTKHLDTHLAPWMNIAYNESGNIAAATTYDYYAVSTTNLVSGAYNYAYGVAWEIGVAELRELVIPTGQIYYLWARNHDAWYQYLNVRYADGAWQLTKPTR